MTAACLANMPASSISPWANGAALALRRANRCSLSNLTRRNKRVIVGPREALGVSRIALKDVNWIGERVGDEDALNGRRLLVRVRSTRPPVPARLEI